MWLGFLLAAFAGWHVRGLRERVNRTREEREDVAAMLRRFGA
jgi:hypothetical protein